MSDFKYLQSECIHQDCKEQRVTASRWCEAHREELIQQGLQELFEGSDRNAVIEKLYRMIYRLTEGLYSK